MAYTNTQLTPEQMLAIRESISGPMVPADRVPPELGELVPPTALAKLPALRPEYVAFAIAYFRGDSPYHLDMKASAHFALMSRAQAAHPLRNRKLAAWALALAEGQPDALSLPEVKAFLTRVTLGEELTSIVTRDGLEQAAFPPASRLQALQIASKIEGYLEERIKLETTEVPQWDLSRLSDQQITYLEYLQALATGKNPEPCGLDLVDSAGGGD